MQSGLKSVCVDLREKGGRCVSVPSKNWLKCLSFEVKIFNNQNGWSMVDWALDFKRFNFKTATLSFRNKKKKSFIENQIKSINVFIKSLLFYFLPFLSSILVTFLFKI